MDCDAGVAPSVKSDSMLQSENLKEPTLVRQLELLVLAMYSVVYQNVQSSLGSMVSEL
jgi:hypothetical protein